MAGLDGRRSNGSSPRPRIGLTAWLRTFETSVGPTPLHAVSRFYVSAVEAAGGVPIMLPSVDADLASAVLDAVDGLVVTGGEDVDPTRYGEVAHPKTQPPDLRRDAFEIAALLEADDRDMPVFCVCRGLQVLNVARGGSLIQDIPDQVDGHPEHARPDAYFEVVHEVSVEPDTHLSEIFSGADRVGVNTAHHQAAERLGRGLRTSAWAPEGFPEALEDERPERFLVAVQWHPEALVERYPEHLAPFRALVDAASRAPAL